MSQSLCEGFDYSFTRDISIYLILHPTYQTKKDNMFTRDRERTFLVAKSHLLPPAILEF